jgi:hypothetical protein
LELREITLNIFYCQTNTDNGSDTSYKPDISLQSELQKMDENLLNSRDLKNVAMSMYRERRTRFPILPKSRSSRGFGRIKFAD